METTDPLAPAPPPSLLFIHWAGDSADVQVERRAWWFAVARARSSHTDPRGRRDGPGSVAVRGLTRRRETRPALDPGRLRERRARIEGPRRGRVVLASPPRQDTAVGAQLNSPAGSALRASGPRASSRRDVQEEQHPGPADPPPQRARNRESAPEEHEADLARQRRLQGRFKRYDAFDGYSSRHDWADPASLHTTSYDTTHRLQTVITDEGMRTLPRADVDVKSGVMRVPPRGNAPSTSTAPTPSRSNPGPPAREGA